MPYEECLSLSFFGSNRLLVLLTRKQLHRAAESKRLDLGMLNMLSTGL